MKTIFDLHKPGEIERFVRFYVKNEKRKKEWTIYMGNSGVFGSQLVKEER